MLCGLNMAVSPTTNRLAFESFICILKLLGCLQLSPIGTKGLLISVTFGYVVKTFKMLGDVYWLKKENLTFF